MGNDDVVSFYRKSWPLIIKLLQVDKTYCIHHGYYEKGVSTHLQSVHRMNDVVGTLLGLDAVGNHTQRILDAGCGIGGTIIHLAKKYPQVLFKGITLLAEHIELAQKLAKEHQVRDNTDFLLADFLDTGFTSNEFDAIYLIESACYAPKKHMLLDELYRILKSGGALVIVDCFRTSVRMNQSLNLFYLWFCKSWGLPNLASVEEFKDLLKTTGFRDIVTNDLTKNVLRSILRENFVSSPYLFTILLHKIQQGKYYKMKDDPNVLAAAAFCSTLLGLKKAITYTAITAVK